jgi:hypothetical protein
MSINSLELEDYEPRSMLAVPVTRVPRARFPVIDFHAHLTWDTSLDHDTNPQILGTADELLPTMDAVNVELMVNLTGGHGNFLRQSIAAHQQPHPDRFVVFAEPAWSRINEPNYPRDQADEVKSAATLGAKGLTIL